MLPWRGLRRFGTGRARPPGGGCEAAAPAGRAFASAAPPSRARHSITLIAERGARAFLLHGLPRRAAVRKNECSGGRRVRPVKPRPKRRPGLRQTSHARAEARESRQATQIESVNLSVKPSIRCGGSAGTRTRSHPAAPATNAIKSRAPSHSNARARRASKRRTPVGGGGGPRPRQPSCFEFPRGTLSRRGSRRRRDQTPSAAAAAASVHQ